MDLKMEKFGLTVYEVQRFVSWYLELEDDDQEVCTQLTDQSDHVEWVYRMIYFPGMLYRLRWKNEPTRLRAFP